jgi:Fe-S-cluster containining protein
VTGPPSLSLDRGDRRLLRVLDDAMAEAARRAGDRLACRAGCTECCHGPFPIHALDAWRLARGLAELAARDSGRAAAIGERARRQTALLQGDFPGDPATGRLDPKDEGEAFFVRHTAVPCPALDPRSGHCELYEHRPATCRTFGPPLRIGEAELPPCRLCFRGAPPEEVESCRVDPDPDGIEDRLAARFRDDSETLIAWVLAPAAPPSP